MEKGQIYLKLFWYKVFVHYQETEIAWFPVGFHLDKFVESYKSMLQV